MSEVLLLAYQPLARKYRPATFADLVGQETTTLALTNAIRLQREPHAIIFAGVRGIGKTTTARLYAKALNCDEGPTPSPCGTCESCRAIEQGNHEDVLEIDGASNTSVDDVRALRETVAYVPQRSKFKIYIIDEVHMLSNNAFNALLKTLEEPPAHVVFVLATTELQKIPQTILSRCQTFRLRKFSQEEIAARVTAILNQEAISFDEAGVNWVARQGRGSMRDALTALDQIIAFGDGAVTGASVALIANPITEQFYLDLLSTILAKDRLALVERVAELNEKNPGFVLHVEELISLCRHAFVLKELGKGSLDIKLLGYESDHLDRLAEIAQSAKLLDLNRLFRTLMRCRTDLDGSNFDRYAFENCLLEWCLDPGIPSIDELRQILNKGAIPSSSARVIATQSEAISEPRSGERRPLNLRRGLSETVDQREASVPAPTGTQGTPVGNTATARSDASSLSNNLTPTFPATWRELIDKWKASKPLQARILEEAYLVEYSPQRIVLAVNPRSLAAAKLLQLPLQAKIREVFRELFAFNGELRVVERKQPAAEGTGEAAHSAADAKPVKEQNILDIKAEEKEILRQQIFHDATNDPTTTLVLDVFNVKIDKVSID